MSNLPKLIDNQRVTLADTLRIIAPEHKRLSIATGYWDLAGTMEIIDQIEGYKSVRIIIGQEPISDVLQKKYNITKLDQFPDAQIAEDLAQNAQTYGQRNATERMVQLRETAKKLLKLKDDGILEVKVFREPRMHAKAYIFGTQKDSNSVGIIGSGNFTKAGLTSNAELNALEDDFKVVNYQPQNDTQEHGHISWFNQMWEEAEDWNGDFSKILEQSPLGNKTFGPYDVYIKTLMEIFPDELIPPKPLGQNVKDVLYDFQNRNAGILINKLAKMKIAMLSDSVGLGKTITAGGVIRHYLDTGKDNIKIIAPAALKQQWIDDLELRLDIEERDYQIISQQDIGALERTIENYKKYARRNKKVDLFVIDEAHNLRSKSGRRHDVIIELLRQHPDAHVLLLTATPINNSLMDIANQIQLASKGKRHSVNVPMLNKASGNLETIDFFDALIRIQSQIRKAEKNGEEYDFNAVKSTIHEGLDHYLVRSTRQGIEKEASLKDAEGNARKFPESDVKTVGYSYDNEIIEQVQSQIINEQNKIFEGIPIAKLNLDILSNVTQHTKHPFDFIAKGMEANGQNVSWSDYLKTEFDIDIEPDNSIILEDDVKSLVPNILQVIFTLGFPVYRPEVYKHDYYGKTISQIRELGNNTKLQIQLAVHNILQVTYLKRLESSAAALMKSVSNYENRIGLFNKYLDKGYIVTLQDAGLLENDYGDGEDIESAFDDYDKWLEEKLKLQDNGDNKAAKELKKCGVERISADPTYYDIENLRNDISRDKKIVGLLKNMLSEVVKPEHNTKMKQFADHIKQTLSSNEYGRKVLVFSFFADTINYLRENLGDQMTDFPNFKGRAEFISGNSGDVKRITNRFSPYSKQYLDEKGDLLNGDTELDFLLATDVLSEGQNLQDAGFLVNYDLHWNPVRMIQRNGRINRLGSPYEKVRISNMMPSNELELYLRLVNRLENKIHTIKNTVGLDQGVLNNADINPIQFIERYYEDGTLPDPDDDLLAHTNEHQLVLREFLAKRTPEEIREAQNIPLGKWNYLPTTHQNSNIALALTKTQAETNETKTLLEDTFFMKTSTVGEYLSNFIETDEALNIIKTDEDDNSRQVDNIAIDRELLVRRSQRAAKIQAENPEHIFSLKPQQKEALGILSTDFAPGMDLIGTIEKGVSDIVIEGKLKKILKSVIDETKKMGAPYASTKDEFIVLYNEIAQASSEDKEIVDVQGVLYYAER